VRSGKPLKDINHRDTESTEKTEEFLEGIDRIKRIDALASHLVDRVHPVQ
jgi:hypothetical protein